MEFNGANQVQVDNVAVDTAAGAKNTVSFWMKWDGTSAVMPFGWEGAYDLYLYSNYFGFNTGNGDLLGTYFPAGTWAGQWVHVAAVFYNGVPSPSTVELYINGERKTLTQVVSSPVSRAATSTARISGWGYNSGYRFDGTLDDVRIYNRALSAEEVAAAMSAPPRVEAKSYTTLGQLVSTVSPEGTINYEYDAVTGALERTYTGLADPTKTSVAADGKAVTDTRYDYDPLGRLAKVTAKERNDQPLASPEATDYVYDLLGNLDQVRLPNGVVSDYDYDSLNRLELLRQFHDDGDHLYEAGVDALLAEFDYHLRDDGKREAVDEKQWMPDTQTIQRTYVDWVYDDVGRLTEEHFDFNYDPLAGFDADRSTKYTFELGGNRHTRDTDTDGDDQFDESVSYDYDANDRLLTEIKNDLTAANQDRYTVYAYNTGNTGTQQTAKTVREGLVPGGQLKEQATYAYNLQGRMSQAQVDADGNGSFETTIAYEYDDGGIRTSQTVNGDKTLYLVDGQNATGYQQVLEEKDASGGIVKSYLLGLDVIAQALSSGAVHFLLYDGHGSTRALVDAQGNIIASPTRQVFAYDAYGLPIGFNPADALTSLLYSGEQLDKLTGLQYLRTRYYDLATGRFTRLDPFAGLIRDPLSLHKYVYGHADPISNVDPSGQIIGALGGFVGLLVGSFIMTTLRAAADSRSAAAGVGILGRLSIWALRYGSLALPGVGLLGGYLVAGWQVKQALDAGALWQAAGTLPDRSENVPLQRWIDNVATVLKAHVDAQPGITNPQRLTGRAAADRLAKGYVQAVQKRAISVFKVEDASDTMFGRNGGMAGWIGNLVDQGGNRDCENWAMEMHGALKSTGVTGGWKLRGHFGTLKAGDFSLGWLFKHNFVSLTFDPNGTGSQPAFILDPWSRARPDIYDFKEFDRHWPIASEAFEWEQIGD